MLSFVIFLFAASEVTALDVKVFTVQSYSSQKVTSKCTSVLVVPTYLSVTTITITITCCPFAWLNQFPKSSRSILLLFVATGSRGSSYGTCHEGMARL